MSNENEYRKPKAPEWMLSAAKDRGTSPWIPTSLIYLCPHCGERESVEMDHNPAECLHKCHAPAGCGKLFKTESFFALCSVHTEDSAEETLVYVAKLLERQVVLLEQLGICLNTSTQPATAADMQWLSDNLIEKLGSKIENARYGG